MNRILGFHDDETRVDAVVDHPTSFRLSLDKAVGERLSARVVEDYRDKIFRPIGHRIVATGTWETTFDVDPGIDSNCFVTQHEGSTFLWVGAPWVVVYGGKLSFMQGRDRRHDVMVLDFNVTPAHLAGKTRTPDTVAYKRSQK